VSLIAPFDPLAGEGTKGWYLLEPPVDETSNVKCRVWHFESSALDPMEAHCDI